MTTPPRQVSIVLFDGFELLDVFGPMELLSKAPDRISLELVGPEEGPVASSQGAQVIATSGYASTPAPDIIMVPGGAGTRKLTQDTAFLTWLQAWARPAPLVTSVCTGSALLAAAGLLDGYRATSNKAAFDWVREQGPRTEWASQARWVEDRERWTSSGVAAGMDMTVALIAHLLGPETAQQIAERIELDVHGDASWDPFAAIHGVIQG